MRSIFPVGLILFALGCSRPQGPHIMDERDVPEYELPALLEQADGTPIETVAAWEQRRKELIDVFRQEIYGAVPAGELDSLTIVAQSEQANVRISHGSATRRQIRLAVWRQGLSQTMELLLYLPSDAAGPVPVFLGLNFHGNHSIQPDTGIWLTPSWLLNDSSLLITESKATDASRGRVAYRWPVADIVSRGYGLATMYYGDIAPDHGRTFQQGVFPLFYEAGQTQPDSSQWGAISAWAWGLSRILDVLETMPDVDAQRVAVLGHSRLGKTALWAGAQDSRFALVISNNSGCVGATLSRRRYGERLQDINTLFPHWFNDQLPRYNEREHDLPIDQHQLLALIAPRPLYVASAEEDWWTDPRGEYLGAYHASGVYTLYGLAGLVKERSPRVDQPRSDGIVGYHVRTGKHNLLAYDWAQFLDVADRWMR